jgi:hypothetical protein
MIAFAVLVLCVVIGSVAGFQFMEAASALIVSSGMSGANQADLTAALQEQLLRDYPLQGIALNVTSWGGFVAWILGIVATATKRGRLWGVLTIILGVLTPVIMVVVMFAAMGPALGAVR